MSTNNRAPATIKRLLAVTSFGGLLFYTRKWIIMATRPHHDRKRLMRHHKKILKRTRPG